MGYLIPKQALEGFLRLLQRSYELVAPLKSPRDGVVRFERVMEEEALSRLDLSVNPPFTAKEYFMAPSEVLFTYDMQEATIKSPPMAKSERVLFGLRLCDLNAVKVLDALFIRRDHEDNAYKQAREQTILVGWYCNEPPSPYCFCESMGLTHYYDIMLRAVKRDGKEYVYLDVGTPRGVAVLSQLDGKSVGGKKFSLVEHHEHVPQIKTKKKLDTHDIRKHYDHPSWKETAENECLSCQRCTLLCPTCLCFDIYDETTTNLHVGERKRTWDSCHAKNFTRVAGGHYFRADRTARFKHRVYHKITYYPETFDGVSMCTGCGRCIEQCPASIDWVELINRMHTKE